MTQAERYPLGPLPQLPAEQRTPEQLEAFASAMQGAVTDWHTLLAGLNAADLARTYRPASWTVLQLAHHVPEAHLHGLIRLKGGLSTPEYVIQPFDQDAALSLPDYDLPVSAALALLDAVNLRWLALLRGVKAEQFDRRITHPQEGSQDLWQLTAKHDWHLRHHLAQARLALN